jgi:GTP cyclohydrolase I
MQSKSNIIDFKANKPTVTEAEEAVRVLLNYIGEDFHREGLIETPKRVIKSFQELYGGYTKDPAQILSKTFEEVEGYSQPVILKNIEFRSMCEHHMLPIVGVAHIAYIPKRRVVGISKLARIVEVFARRLQIQEKMTVQIADAINDALMPLGVAVVIEAEHHCMTGRGVNRTNSLMKTCHFIGSIKDDSLF